MINILALLLVLSSIGVGVFSPNPEKKNSRIEDVIVKEAHRVVFVEYEREFQPKKEYKPITESSSSSSFEAQIQKPLEIEQRGLTLASSLLGDVNEKMRGAACSAIPNLGHGISGETFSGASEKAKQVADEGLDIAKDLVSYKAHLVEKGAKAAKTSAIETGKKIEEGYEKAKEKIPQKVAETVEWKKEAIGSAKDKILEKTHDFKEAFEDAKESATESFKKFPQRVAEKVEWEKEAIGDAKEKILEKTHDLSEGIGAVKDSLKEKTQEIPEALSKGKEKVMEKTQDLSEGIGDVKEKTKRFITQVPSRGKWKVLDRAYDLKEAAEETATDASERIGGPFSKANEKVREKTSTVEEAIEEAKEKIPEKLSEAKDKVLDKSKDLTEETAMKAKEMVSDKAHLLKEAAAGAKESVSEKAHDFKEAIEETAAETPKKVSEGFDKTKETVMKRIPETISEKAHEFKEAIEETAAETPKKVSEGFDKAKETVMSRMPESMGKVSKETAPHEEVLEGLFSKSKEKVLEKAQELEASSKESIKTATEGTKRFKGELKHKFNMLKTALIDDRTIHQKTTHFFIEGSRNFTSLFTRGFIGVYHASDENVNWFVGVARLIGFATAYGSCVWVTFMSSHVLSGALPRQQYGMVQSKIYPVYFRLMAYTLGLSLFGHFLTKHHDKSYPSEKSHGYDLMASIGLVLVNLFFLEPLATKAMFDIMKREKEEGRGIDVEPSTGGVSRMDGEVYAEVSERQAEGEVREEDKAQHEAQLEKLNKRLKRLNTISAFCNILTLMVLTSHLAFLSHCLYTRC